MSWLTKVNSKHYCCTTVHVQLLLYSVFWFHLDIGISSLVFWFHLDIGISSLVFWFHLDIGISSLQTVVAAVLHCGRDGETERT